MPPPIFAPIFIAGATTAIGYFFQEHSKTIAIARQTNEAELIRVRQQREAELAQAQATFTEVSQALGKLDHYISQSIYVAYRRSINDPQGDDKANWDGLQAALLSWAENRTRITALVSRYFGATNYECLMNIDSAFERAMRFVNETYYNTDAHKRKQLTYKQHTTQHFSLMGDRLQLNGG
jgi:hypothetical protein